MTVTDCCMNQAHVYIYCLDCANSKPHLAYSYQKKQSRTLQGQSNKSAVLTTEMANRYFTIVFCIMSKGPKTWFWCVTLYDCA
jgi:hypothetical protein